MKKKALLFFYFFVIFLMYSCNPYFKNYNSNFKMKGYIFYTSKGLLYQGKKYSISPPIDYYFVPSKYVKIINDSILIFKKNPTFYELNIKCWGYRNSVIDGSKKIFQIEKDGYINYTYYYKAKILFKKQYKEKKYNIKNYNICLNNIDTINIKMNFNFFLVEILEEYE